MNYDQIAEYSLLEVSRGQGLCGMMNIHYELLGPTPPDIIDQLTPREEEVKGGLFLKLHGSISWLYCHSSSCPNHSKFYANRLAFQSLNAIELKKSHYTPGALCRTCGSPLVSVIVPPAMLKAFDQFPKLGLIWSLAFKKLKEADSIVIIGASLPESDYYLRWLISHSVTSRKGCSTPKVTVVNTNREVACRVQRLTGIRPEYVDSFEEYIRRLDE